jgi:hypothetical protein
MLQPPQIPKWRHSSGSTDTRSIMLLQSFL